jgi:hypothetical protein
VVGLIDGKRENGKWLVTGLDITKPVDPDALAPRLHRFARIAGREKVAAGAQGRGEVAQITLRQDRLLNRD